MGNRTIASVLSYLLENKTVTLTYAAAILFDGSYPEAFKALSLLVGKGFITDDQKGNFTFIDEEKAEKYIEQNGMRMYDLTPKELEILENSIDALEYEVLRELDDERGTSLKALQEIITNPNLPNELLSLQNKHVVRYSEGMYYVALSRESMVNLNLSLEDKYVYGDDEELDLPDGETISLAETDALLNERLLDEFEDIFEDEDEEEDESENGQKRDHTIDLIVKSYGVQTRPSDEATSRYEATGKLSIGDVMGEIARKKGKIAKPELPDTIDAILSYHNCSRRVSVKFKPNITPEILIKEAIAQDEKTTEKPLFASAGEKKYFEVNFFDLIAHGLTLFLIANGRLNDLEWKKPVKEQISQELSEQLSSNCVPYFYLDMFNNVSDLR